MPSNIETAIHWWLSENSRQEKAALSQIRSPIMQLFYYADALQSVLAVKPLDTTGPAQARISSTGARSIYFIGRLTPEDFFMFRGVLALIGDIYCLAKYLRSVSDDLDIGSLSALLDRHLPTYYPYREARNFLAHIDERLSNLPYHGVSDSLNISELGLTFHQEAQDCFYLGFANDGMYYHDRQRGEAQASPKSISLSPQDLTTLFDFFRELYDLVTSHAIHATTYALSRTVYIL